MTTKSKQIKRAQRQQELLKLFDADFYQEKLVGDKWYVKQYNRGNDKWQVAVYSKESFSRYKQFSAKD